MNSARNCAQKSDPSEAKSDPSEAKFGSLRDQVQDNRAALARIEAILDERLPRDN